MNKFNIALMIILFFLISCSKTNKPISVSHPIIKNISLNNADKKFRVNIDTLVESIEANVNSSSEKPYPLNIVVNNGQLLVYTSPHNHKIIKDYILSLRNILNTLVEE